MGANSTGESNGVSFRQQQALALLLGMGCFKQDHITLFTKEERVVSLITEFYGGYFCYKKGKVNGYQWTLSNKKKISRIFDDAKLFYGDAYDELIKSIYC